MTNKFFLLNKKTPEIKQKIFTSFPGIRGVGMAFIGYEGSGLQEYNEFLNPDEIALSKNRIDSLAGRLAAKKAINEALNKKIPFKKISILSSKTSGPLLFPDSLKDYYDVGDLALSITHEDKLAVSIVLNSEKKIFVGIDLAKITRVDKAFRDEKILDYILTSDEKVLFSKTGDAALFWSCKEAVAKALGMGIWHGGYLHDIVITNVSDEIEVTLKNKPLKLFEKRNCKQIKIIVVTDDVYKSSIAVISA